MPVEGSRGGKMRCWSCERENPPAAKFCRTCGAGLGCPDCGAPFTPGQRFCTNCGRRAPVRGAQTVIRRLEQRLLDTPHFRIRFGAESYAEQQAPMIGERMERALAVLTALLAPVPPAPGKIDVTLSDILYDPEQPGTTLAGGGYAVPERLEIREVFRPEAPGDGLERSLLRIILARALGEDRPRPPMVMDMLLAMTMQRLGAFPPDDQIIPGLAVAKSKRQLPPITTVLSGSGQGNPELMMPSLLAFANWLYAAQGAEKFKGFVARFDPTRPDEAARAAFSTSLAQLDKTWRKSLRVAQPGGIMRFLRLSFKYLAVHRLKVIEIATYIVLSVGFGIGLQKMQQLLVDRALPGFNREGDLRALAFIMGAVVAAFIFVSLTSLRENYLSAWVSEKVLMDMRLRIFANVQRLEPAFFNRIGTGDIMSRMTSDLAAIEFALTGAVEGGFRILLTLVMALATVLWLDWKLALIALAGTPLLFVAGRWLGPAAAKASYERQEHLATSTSVLQENLAAQPVVKGFGLERKVLNDYTDSLNTLFRSSLRLTFLSSIFGLSANSIASAIQLFVLGLGGYLVINGNLTIGVLFAFLGLLGQIIGPLQSVSSILQALQQASGAMDRVEELLHAEPTIQDSPNAKPAAPLRGSIRFENVSFSYTGDQPNLRGVSFFIPAGKSVAFVGPSGCGKSTTLNLIQRFYDPNNGRVSWDGVPLQDLGLGSLRSQMGVVFQDNFLFNMSLRENIRYGRLDATDAEVEEAAKAAELHELIMQMPEGYDTLVGERGGRLSGGQRQRVAIARALLRNPSVLLLDEATSALDPRTEAAINETLDRISRGRTTIAVTHRLASIVNVDRIFVFDRGQLVEEGTHDDLVKKGGLYANLWQEQGGFTLEAGVQYVGVEAQRLQGVPMFTQLGSDLLGALARRLAVERFPAGDIIVNEGEIGDKLYVIHKGQVEVLSYDRAGQQRRINTLREGDHFGEIALLYNVPRIATIRALSPCQLYSLSKGDFDILLGAVPGLRDQLTETMAQRTLVSAKA